MATVFRAAGYDWELRIQELEEKERKKKEQEEKKEASKKKWEEKKNTFKAHFKLPKVWGA